MGSTPIKNTETPSPTVLYEDNHLLVINKPAGLATMGTEPQIPTAARWAADYLKRKYHKPGNVFVGIVSRVDRLASGVLPLARTSKCASRLSEQIRNREPSKRYLAYVDGKIASASDSKWTTLRHHVRKNESRQRMEVVQPSTRDAQLAELHYRCLARSPNGSLIEVDLITGRKHQIRLQFSELGHPIVGDAKYGSQRKFGPGIALHCWELRIAHPTRGETLTFSAKPQGPWQQLPRAVHEALPRSPTGDGS
ncbi:Ribosomal large subunit pseudouridine synthase A [Aureliella helgolandensis]|uniref:Ribosomal large subunit pseudouridine synthase A n=2 Tax=Aureliella helgolandensis TaxID=2527968 RepID=A0A518G9U5_9BACT|nr:Ribosomal large subunit pseudouridine synthase A [Aureliella helgolandensis]